MAKRQPVLISEDKARVQWNQMTRKEKENLANKIRKKIHSKDVGEAHRYSYGNLYPKTRAAIRRHLSGR